MTVYVLRWDVEPGYDEFIGVTKGAYMLEVAEGVSVEDVLDATRVVGMTGERLSSVVEIALCGDEVLRAAVATGIGLHCFQWDWETGGWTVIVTRGDDHRGDGTSLYEALVPLGEWWEEHLDAITPQVEV